MKVFILTTESFPDGMAATHRVRCYARALVGGGIDCEVVLFPSEGEGVYKGVRYQGVRDVLDYVKRNLGSGDVLFLYLGKQLELTISLAELARSRGAFCIRDLCELPYGTGGQNLKTLYFRKRLLHKQFPRLDGIISISDRLSSLARKNASRSCKHIKVPIMVEPEGFIEGEYQEASEPYIFHSGTFLERKDGILGIIKAFGLAAPELDPSVKYIMAGNLDSSPQKEEILGLISGYALQDRIVFTGPLQDKELRKYLMRASLTILNKHPNSQNLNGFSTKLGEYLAAARPVVITDVGEAMNWLEDGKTAYVTPHGDTNALSNAIVKAFADPEGRRKIGLNGRELAMKSFDCMAWSKPLAAFINSLGK
jgi:glycosyltransferase involved in cell wall biosynthesis